MFPLSDTAPRRHFPLLNWLLIGANLLVFLFAVTLSREQVQALFHLYGVVPARYVRWDLAGWEASLGPLPFLVSLFLHAGWFHLLSNLWTLWIFGDNVEDRMGPLRFLFFYVTCGLLASLVHVLSNPDSEIPTVGASGAISGVMGAYLLLFPMARILTLVPVLFYPLFLEIPAVIFIAVWFYSQFFSGLLALGGGDVSGIAWWAHVGGFVTGMVLCPLFLRPRRRRDQLM